MKMLTHSGGCHCGAIRFEVDAPAELSVTECNCSICTRSGNLHLFVDKAHFRLLQGEDNLTRYSFDSHEAKHLFCKTCGIKSFYIPRSHPDGYSINARCLDEDTIQGMNITPFDGKNWEQNVDKLKPLSDDE